MVTKENIADKVITIGYFVSLITLAVALKTNRWEWVAVSGASFIGSTIAYFVID